MAFFEIRGISKGFPGVRALSDVSLSIESGEVRALVGENGAGKSTLMKILNGNHRADSGSILIDGEQVSITDPRKAAELGISIIFQELNLIDSLSIAENIFAGRLRRDRRLIDWKDIYARTQILLDRIGFKAEPRTEVGSLSIAGKQMVEIAKALSHDARMILMDEPSATLTKKELEELFSIIRDLKSKGVAITYISHRLEEIFEICDSVTILRDGKIIGTKPVLGISRDEIVEMMVGREIENTFPKRKSNIGEEVLRVENLRRKNGKASVSFTLHAGEILGMAGLVGAGRTEIMRALFGVDYKESGEVFVRGRKARVDSPKAAKREGLAFLTEDRKAEGLVLDFNVKMNIVMANLRSILCGFWLSNRRENKLADWYIERVNIKTPSRFQKIGNLSGGNQQKVVVSKWLNADADILIMDEPTRGIDVGAKLEIYELIVSLVEKGKSVIMISSELPEVLGMCDRLLVMKNDAIVAELEGEAMSAVNVMKYALQ